MKLLFYDLETTGTDPKVNGIHQIAYSFGLDGEIQHLRMNPVGREINPAALEIARVTEQQVQEQPSAKSTFDLFRHELHQRIDRYDKQDKLHLVGFNNARFDDAFLYEWWQECGDKYFFSVRSGRGASTSFRSRPSTWHLSGT